MKEVISIFLIKSHFDFSPLIAVFIEISSQAFYLSYLKVANECQRDLETLFVCFTPGLNLGF